MCDADIRSQLMSNVILTGGNSLLTGFSERLVTDLQARTPPALRFKLINLQSQQQTAERLFRYLNYFKLHLIISNPVLGLVALYWLPWEHFIKCGFLKKNMKSKEKHVLRPSVSKFITFCLYSIFYCALPQNHYIALYDIYIFIFKNGLKSGRES